MAKKTVVTTPGERHSFEQSELKAEVNSMLIDAILSAFTTPAVTDCQPLVTKFREFDEKKGKEVTKRAVTGEYGLVFPYKGRLVSVSATIKGEGTEIDGTYKRIAEYTL